MFLVDEVKIKFLQSLQGYPIRFLVSQPPCLIRNATGTHPVGAPAGYQVHLQMNMHVNEEYL